MHWELDNPWITGSGSCTRSKNFKTPFFSRYQKFLSWGNSNGSKTTPKFFSIFFSTNMVARGDQRFCILGGATDPLIEQWLKFWKKNWCVFRPIRVTPWKEFLISWKKWRFEIFRTSLESRASDPWVAHGVVYVVAISCLRSCYAVAYVTAYVVGYAAAYAVGYVVAYTGFCLCCL